jgi:hypothetical protein
MNSGFSACCKGTGGFIRAAALGLALVGAALLAPQVRAQSSVVPSISWIKSLSRELGQPLLSTAIDLSNRNRIVLQSLTPESATFLFGSKEPGESFESLRKRASLSIVLSACSGNTSLDGPIASVAVWEQLDERESKLSGKVLKEVLELVNDPPGISTPSNLRAPRLPGLVGPVFEYARGTQIIVVGLLNETSASNDRLMLNWAASDPSVCRKP